MSAKEVKKALHSFLAAIVQGFVGEPAELIAAVEVTPSGIGLHGEAPDADFTVKGLLAGIFGTKAWMAERWARPYTGDS